jgi:hypothetical protein
MTPRCLGAAAARALRPDDAAPEGGQPYKSPLGHVLT